MRKYTQDRFICACLVLASLPVVCATANGLRNPPEGAAATGLGLGKIATLADPSAVVHNPANLAGATSDEVMVSATFALFEVNFSSPDGRSGSSDSSVNLLPSVFGVHPLTEDVTLGLGLFVPFGQSSEWEKDGPFRGVAPYFAELHTLNVNPNLAVRVNDKLSIAAGVSAVFAEIETKQLLVSPTDPTGPAADARAEGDDTAFAWNLAATLKPAEGHTIGATYRSGFDANYSGDTTISGAPPPFSPNSSFSSKIEFPQIVGLGYGLKINERLTVGVDAEWTEFSSYASLPLSFGANTPFLPFPPAIPQEWDDSWSYGLGLIYEVSDVWTVRGGYDYFESPVPENTLAPTLPDGDRHAFSLGLGMQREQHRIDISYAISLNDVDVEENQNPFYKGTYDMDRHVVAVSYILSL